MFPTEEYALNFGCVTHLYVQIITQLSPKRGLEAKVVGGDDNNSGNSENTLVSGSFNSALKYLTFSCRLWCYQRQHSLR